ncbi:MAG: hypothetical protein ABI288_07755 [Ginsengibacter sp.]
MQSKNLLIVSILIYFTSSAIAQGNGYLIKDGRQLFPIGWYSTPKDDAALKDLADAGINITRVSSKDDLDRLQAAGIQGWMPLPLQNGVTEALKKQIMSVVSHPALALWEGPDEIILTFTQDYQYSLTDPSNPFSKPGKHDRSNHITSWRNRTPEMERYAREKSSQIRT